MLKHWHYPNLMLLTVSLALTAFVLGNGWFDLILDPAKQWGYVGIFISGLFFVSTFTVGPAAAVLFLLAAELNPIFVAIAGGLGAMCGDYIAFRYIRERLLAELNPFLKALHLYRPINVVRSKYFAWLAPVIGMFIIASPLPDEVGLSLLGLTKIKIPRLLAITFVLHTTAMLLIALAAQR